MKLKQTLLSLCGFTMLCALTTTLNAQVTIGSTEKPVDGALLDLKDGGTYSNGESAVRGLGMARVELTNTSDLFPMFEKDGVGYKDAVKADEDKKHVGLLVYNTNSCLTGEGYEDGLYVWDGSQWQWLNRPAISPDVGVFVDSRDGETYHYRQFGNAGKWMLENLRYADPSFTFSVQQVSTEISSSYTLKRVSYPNTTLTSSNNGNPSVPPNTWTKAQGLLYSYSAATMGKWDGQSIQNGNNENEHLNIATQTQGVCPVGWRVPTDYEWSQLEEELAKNPILYSTIVEPQPWADRKPGSQSGIIGSGELPHVSPDANDYYQQYNFRPYISSSAGLDPSARQKGHGYVAGSPCSLGDETSNGKSFSASKGGFAALFTGDYFNTGNFTIRFGINASFWTASAGTLIPSQTAWFRRFYPLSSDSNRLEIRRINMFSVRCKQN